MKRGFIIADALMGLAVLAIVIGVLASAAARSSRATRQLSNAREAARLAEATLCTLEAGRPLPSPPAGVTIEIKPCDEPATISSRRWVEALVTVEGQTRILIGLVPASDAAGDAK